MVQRKPTGFEGLSLVKDDGPLGPHHRKVKSVIEDVMGVVVHVELECGHTVVIFNPAEMPANRGGLLFCGECEEHAKASG